MSGERAIEFIAADKGDRLDKLLTERVGDISRSAWQRLIESGAVTVNDAAVKSNYRTREGDRIVAQVPTAESEPGPVAENMPLDIVYEDEFVLVVNKPAGMVVHPAAGHATGTLVNALLGSDVGISDENQPDRPGIVHRLDKETSGLLVVAKSGAVRATLQAGFKGRAVRKIYLALVEGRVANSHALIMAPLGRDPRHRKRMAVLAGGREASTEYRVLEQFQHNTYLTVELHTGRTHQIRVHLAYIGHPVVGDTVYGYRRQRISLDRHFLHAAELSFAHPVSGAAMHFSTPLPEDLQGVLDRLRAEP